MLVLPVLCSLKLTQKNCYRFKFQQNSFRKNAIEDTVKVNVSSDLAEKLFSCRN